VRHGRDRKVQEVDVILIKRLAPLSAAKVSAVQATFAGVLFSGFYLLLYFLALEVAPKEALELQESLALMVCGMPLPHAMVGFICGAC
jgi:hypothetical protein